MKFYEVTDWDEYCVFYTSKAEAIKEAKKLPTSGVETMGECLGMRWNKTIEVTRIDIGRINKRKIMALLSDRGVIGRESVWKSDQ